MALPHYDAVVVGAGIQGSAASYYLASTDYHNVLLLEQFDRDHTRGSSHGFSRITRNAYKKPFYVVMMSDAFRMWSELEETAQVNLYKQTGYLLFGKLTESYIKENIECLRSNRVPFQQFSGYEANQRFPRQLKLPPSYQCVYEETGGIIFADKARQTFQREFMKLGGTLLDNHHVTEIIPGETVTVVTNRGSFLANKLVLAVGPWARMLCSTIGVDLPFKVKRVESLHWKLDNPEDFLPDTFPVTFGLADGKGFYSIPVAEYTNMMKISTNDGVWADADSVDVNCGPVTVPAVASFASSTFKGIANKPSVVKYCKYTVSPDYNPVIDTHPKYENIIIAAGFTGHGFKLSPVVGKLIAELVRGDTLSHDIHHFRASRFTSLKSPL